MELRFWFKGFFVKDWSYIGHQKKYSELFQYYIIFSYQI